jgi:hypothetical protein
MFKITVTGFYHTLEINYYAKTVINGERLFV